MRPHSAIAVVLDEDGTGKVILSGSRQSCGLAAQEENQKRGRAPGCVAVYEGVVWSDVGSLVDQEALTEKARTARADSSRGLGIKLTGLKSARNSIRNDQVANETAATPNSETGKRLSAALEAVNAEIEAASKAHDAACKREAAERQRLNDEAAGVVAPEPEAPKPAAKKAAKKK